MLDLTDDVAWCLAGTTAEHPCELRSLLACVDCRQRLVATGEELRHVLGHLRADGRAAGDGGRYFATEPGSRDPPPLAEPTDGEVAAAVRAYVDEGMGDEPSRR